MEYRFGTTSEKGKRTKRVKRLKGILIAFHASQLLLLENNRKRHRRTETFKDRSQESAKRMPLKTKQKQGDKLELCFFFVQVFAMRFLPPFPNSVKTVHVIELYSFNHTHSRKHKTTEPINSQHKELCREKDERTDTSSNPLFNVNVVPHQRLQASEAQLQNIFDSIPPLFRPRGPATLSSPKKFHPHIDCR